MRVFWALDCFGSIPGAKTMAAKQN